MCKLKSAIILKNKIFMPDYDSHSDMLSELGIEDNYLGASKTFVRAELSPVDGDVFSDIDTWKLNVDQDFTPEWFSEEEYKPLMVEKVKEWAKTHIHIGVEGLKISAGQNHYIKDCKDVEIYDSASVKYIRGSASVEYICGSASVEKLFGFATVSSSRHTEWKNKASLVITENATFRDCYNKVIYQAGDWKLVGV